MKDAHFSTLLGLTAQEALLYETLLPLGDVPVAELTSATKLHPQIVYRLLERLTVRGLVVATTKRHRKYVRAEEPAVLKHREEQRLEALKNEIPRLEALRKTTPAAAVRIERGNEAVRALRLRAITELRAGDTLRIIGGSGDRYYQAVGDKHGDIERARIRKKIARKLITAQGQKKLFASHEKFMELSEFRYLPSDFPIISSTTIFRHTVAITIWDTEPILIIIESPAMTKSYSTYFEELWKAARR